MRTQRKWQICSTCEGEGKHSRHLGAYTSDEFHREFDDESAEHYFSGDYDKPCGDCEGTGKVRVERHQCRCCGEETQTGRDCCSDDFPEPGEMRETGR
jgi:RecJ-like exonuclease